MKRNATSRGAWLVERIDHLRRKLYAGEFADVAEFDRTWAELSRLLDEDEPARQAELRRLEQDAIDDARYYERAAR